MGRRAAHVSVNKALAVCDGFSKLLKTLRQRTQGKVRQRDAGQDVPLFWASESLYDCPS